MTGVRTIAVVTGSRADFGLLRPVMEAIDAHPDLRLDVVVTGTHLLPPANTGNEVEAAFPVVARVPMQAAGVTGRLADAAALGRGTVGFATLLARLRPDVLLVLGDRIEAFAAASAAAVAGTRVAHVHGGDRAEGIADEGMRHAISKLAHLHLTATAGSTERLVAMGESPLRTHLVGSPALDGLDAIPPISDAAYAALGAPDILFLVHPTGRTPAAERTRAARLLDLCRHAGRVLALHPNHDPGRSGVLQAIEQTPDVRQRPHLPRRDFIGLLRRVRIIVGNSSAGLIEAAAVPTRCLNIGRRQSGRQMPAHVVNCPSWEGSALRLALDEALLEPVLPFRHPYGDGRAGERIAGILATFEPDKHPLAKQNTY